MKGTKDNLFHKVRHIEPLSDFRLFVEFEGGEEKEYDVKRCFDRWPVFRLFLDKPEEFEKFVVDPDGFGVIWNEEIDLGCNELYNNGVSMNNED